MEKLNSEEKKSLKILSCDARKFKEMKKSVKPEEIGEIRKAESVYQFLFTASKGKYGFKKRDKCNIMRVYLKNAKIWISSQYFFS